MTENNSTPNRIVIACGDGRLDHYLDQKYNDGKTLFVRNPGAVVPLTLQTMRELFTEHPGLANGLEVVLVPHIGCGAMGLVADGPKEGPIHKSFISLFRDSAFKDRHDLEHNVNPALQKTEVEGFLKSMGVSAKVAVDTVDVPALEEQGAIPDHKGGKTLVITPPGTDTYSSILERVNPYLSTLPVSKGGGERSISDMYVLQMDLKDPNAVLLSEIFVRFVGTKNVVFVPGKNLEAATTLANELNRSAFRSEMLDLGRVAGKRKIAH